MENHVSQKLKTSIEKIMEVNFGNNIKNGNKRQVYEAVLTATNEILAEKRYEYSKKVKEQEAKQVYICRWNFWWARH